jgi:hypothetical protein
MREREFEVLSKELLNVRALDIFSLLEFDNLKDLQNCVRIGRETAE